MRVAVLSRLVVSVLLPVPGLAVPDPVAAIVERAEVAAKEGKVEEAAGLFGDALALAQSRGDLPAEGKAAEAWSRFLSRVREAPPPAAGGAVSAVRGPADRRDARAIVMERLDPGRNGAFVSAPILAGDLLLESTARGDGRFVKEAATVLARHERRASSGRCLMAMARYAAGMRARAEGNREQAVSPLAEALDRFVEGGWPDLAVHAAVELAALRIAAGDTDGAAEALSAAAEVFSRNPDLRLAFRWKSMTRVRLADAPEEVLAPLLAAVDPVVKAAAGRPGREGKPGGGGEDAGPVPPVSPVGEALRRVPRGKPIATVVRERDGIVIRVSWDPRYRRALPRTSEVVHWVEGGLVLAVFDASIAMMVVDPVGIDGAPGAAGDPEPGRAWYRLDRGETWSFSKEGVVSFTP